MKSESNTAVVEKIWKIETRNFRFDPDKFDYVLVRPCNVSYKTYKNFCTGKRTKCKMITHEGAVLSWHRDKSFSLSNEPHTFEELMLNASFNKQIVPEFENWLFDTVDHVDGIPVISVQGLIEMKKDLGREKDLRDIALINDFLARNSK